MPRHQYPAPQVGRLKAWIASCNLGLLGLACIGYLLGFSAGGLDFGLCRS
jgi:hypothetical protein